MRTLLLAALLLAGNAVIADEKFDFRSPDRPTFERRLSVDELEALGDAQDVTVIDVRLIEDFDADPQLITGAAYRDPDDIGEWAGSLPADRKIVVYCVRGKWVSQKAATYLEGKGYEVYSLEGGIEAWKERQHE